MTENQRWISLIALVLILCSCATIWSNRRESDDLRLSIEDETLVYMAKAELASVRNGFNMYLVDGGESAYPSTAAINSYDNLKYVLSDFVQLLDEELASFTFHSYARAGADTFILKATAKDSKRTIITVTPTSITP